MDQHPTVNDISSKPFTHNCRNGCIFMADRCDLRGDVYLYVPAGTSQAHIAAATLEAGGWHAANIWPKLNGFAGYDNVKISVVSNA
jgi:hypothetical protein